MWLIMLLLAAAGLIPFLTLSRQPQGPSVAMQQPFSDPPLPARVAPREADGPTRLGLHVTAAELDAWRQRAISGPYKVEGDVSPNSPGDWSRIEDYAEAFMRNPSEGRWKGPEKNNPDGCVQGGNREKDSSPPIYEPSYLRDAAFYAMVKVSPEHALTVKEELLAQAQEPGVGFSDRDRWCTGKILDINPGFLIATWLTKLLFATSYLEVHNPDIFDPDEKQLLDDWFADAAEWMAYDTDLKLNELFVDRLGGNYTLTDRAKEPLDERLYYEGPEASTLHRRFNNRNARQARFVTLVGVSQDNEDFIEHGKRYFKDALTYGYFPEGATGDFERWTPKEPIKGWKYSAEFTGALITIADHLERIGDPSLYEFSTTDGALGTGGEHHGGGPKTLETLIEDLLGYVDGTFERYGTDDPQRQDDDDYLIGSVNGVDGDARINDLEVVMANRYYENDYIKAVYTRRAEGAPPYPDEPARGKGDPESGEGGVYPGVLFMFGQTEDLS